jgi:hypothetical protein
LAVHSKGQQQPPPPQSPPQQLSSQLARTGKLMAFTSFLSGVSQ